MNICFLFVSLLSFSISGAAISPMFENPALFISTLVDANPATIRKMKDMVQELIDAGEAERSFVIDEHETAQSRYDSAVEAQAQAAEEKNVAGGNKQTQLNIANELTGVEATAAAKRADALNTLNAKKADSIEATEIRESEIIRLDNEKVLMQAVLEKLETLLPGVDLLEGKLTVVDFIVGRRLLADSAVIADRDAVQKIVDKINQLVGTGEGERQSAIRDDTNAKSAWDEADAYHENAVTEHQAAAGALGSAEAELKRLSGIFSVKCSEKEEADDELASATSDLAIKKKTREDEETRLDSEKATLETVDGLLDDLLASE